MNTKKIKIKVIHIEDKILTDCLECSSCSSTSTKDYLSGMCSYHHRYLDTDSINHKIPIPEWCEIDKYPFPIDM